jgi:hypothetical protein
MNNLIQMVHELDPEGMLDKNVNEFSVYEKKDGEATNPCNTLLSSEDEYDKRGDEIDVSKNLTRASSMTARSERTSSSIGKSGGKESFGEEEEDADSEGNEMEVDAPAASAPSPVAEPAVTIPTPQATSTVTTGISTPKSTEVTNQVRNPG